MHARDAKLEDEREKSARSPREQTTRRRRSRSTYNGWTNRHPARERKGGRRAGRAVGIQNQEAELKRRVHGILGISAGREREAGEDEAREGFDGKRVKGRERKIREG